MTHKERKEYTEWINDLRAKVERLSKPDTRFKEILSKYMERTEALHHKVALTDLNTANRDFSAGYVRALEDLMKYFERVNNSPF
jgi:hypothetical protein